MTRSSVHASMRAVTGWRDLRVKPLVFLDLEILLCSVSAAGERLVRAGNILSEWAEVGRDPGAEARRRYYGWTLRRTAHGAPFPGRMPELSG